ncbi:MAG: RNase adapter RapZ [Eubacteriales bacterium]
MEFLIVSGMSGGGKSRTLSTLEDLGFYCVDNLPEEMIPQFAQLCMATKGRYDRVALVTDVRSGVSFEGFCKALEEVEQLGCAYSVVFIEAETPVLIKRYKETRRTHPLNRDGADLLGAVQRERALLEPIRNRANFIVNTSHLSSGKLRGVLTNLFAGEQRDHAMNVQVLSFGFKHGLPIDADLVFDVRFLPNPFYIDDLKHKTGLDAPVRDFVFSYQQTKDFVEKTTELLTMTLPYYVEEGKTSLVIAVGCTGGHHRSVAVAKELAEAVTKMGFVTHLGHRDLSRE